MLEPGREEAWTVTVTVYLMTALLAQPAGLWAAGSVSWEAGALPSLEECGGVNR